MPKSRRGPSDKNRRRPTGAKKRPAGHRGKPAAGKRPDRNIPGPSATPTGAQDPALSARVLALVRKSRQSPPSLGEISRALRLSPQQAPLLARALHDLELAGEVVRVRHEHFALPSDADLVVGTIQLHRDGSAHLLRDLPGEPEFYLSPENTATALPGDRVVIRHLRDQPPYRGYQPCGRVI
ncbi:MAG: hypothetical protein ACO3RX_07160, partial [Chthoniobacterales bacterium]